MTQQRGPGYHVHSLEFPHSRGKYNIENNETDEKGNQGDKKPWRYVGDHDEGEDD